MTEGVFYFQPLTLWRLPFYNSKNRNLKINSKIAESDYVVCAFCSQRCGGWDPEDIPMEAHKKFSPECTFLSGLEVNGMYLINKVENFYFRAADISNLPQIK